jgi:hypothetical protein
MKKAILLYGTGLRAMLILLGASMTLLSGCGKDPQTPTPEQPGGSGEPGETDKTEVKFSSSITPPVAATRATESEWVSGDEMGVFMVEAGKTLSDETVVDNALNRNFRTGGNGLFTPLNANHVLYYPTDGSAVDFVAYYPYRSDSHVSDFKYRVDVGDQSAPDLYLLYSDNAKGKTEENTAANELQFVHKLSRVTLDVTLTGGVDDISGTDITIEGVHTAADFSLADASFTYTGGAGVITPRSVEPGELDAVYEAVVIPTISSGEARTIVFDIPDVGRYSYDIPAATQFTAGKIHHLDVTVSPKGVVVTTGEIEDWTGKNDPVETGTAEPVVVVDPDEEMLLLPNSYIVAPGETIKIPVGKAYAMWRFDPLLKTAEDDMTGTVTAKMVWEDPKGLMATGSVSISGEGKDAEITVVTTEAFPDGNISVGLYIDDVIYWSWHLWITPYNPELPASQTTNNGFTFMDRNLGSWNTIADMSKRGRATGRFYQWGRKDPFLTTTEYMTGPQSVYDSNGATLAIGNNKSTVSEDPLTDLVWSIRNPISFRQASGAVVDWFSGDDDYSANRWNNPDGSKSVFDPCPEGWRVPTSGAGSLSPWHGITTTDATWDSGTNCRGWTIPDHGYFPASGYFNTTGTMTTGTVGFMPHLWTATQSPDDGYAYCLRATSTTWEPNHSLPRATAMPIRCVKEE